MPLRADYRPIRYTNFNKLYYDKERTYCMKPIKEGKVREIYDNGDSLIMVATDRISCFDVILKKGNRCPGSGST